MDVIVSYWLKIMQAEVISGLVNVSLERLTNKDVETQVKTDLISCRMKRCCECMLIPPLCSSGITRLKFAFMLHSSLCSFTFITVIIIYKGLHSALIKLH